jgi:hypothetical protein
VFDEQRAFEHDDLRLIRGAAHQHLLPLGRRRREDDLRLGVPRPSTAPLRTGAGLDARFLGCSEATSLARDLDSFPPMRRVVHPRLRCPRARITLGGACRTGAWKIPSAPHMCLS